MVVILVVAWWSWNPLPIDRFRKNEPILFLPAK